MTQRGVQELRRALARRQKEKAELELQVRSFQSRFHDEVAPLQEEVLRLQKERLKQAAQTRMRSARLRNAYHDAEEAYEAFRDRRQEVARAAVESTSELKATYRRASKACHPDAVPDTYGDEAAATFQALESAYEAGQQRTVEAIADALEQWGFPEASVHSPREEDAGDQANLRRAVSALNASIDQLRESDVYQALSASGDVDLESVIVARKRELQRRLQELQRRQPA
ncbi:MAG: hypothetical protein ABEL04_13025 [Salinibacter sp.]|uniref:hypothetical protein n=1 Tax=Salinibacter sp. TaxID=2065818 RepID=UPI0035D517FD